MKKASAETVLEMVLSVSSADEVLEEGLFPLGEAISTPETHEALELRRIDGVVIGVLVGLNKSGEPLVDFPGNPSGEHVPAHSTMVLGKDNIGRQVVLMFESGDPQKPIVMGLIQHAEEEQAKFPAIISSEQQPLMDVEVDGERLVFTGQKEIVLRCGKASITLTRAGKIIIRGAYLLSRSSGVNRIKGGSVQIN
jgi:hypothetical protein